MVPPEVDPSLRRVLLIDDDPDIHDLVRTVLAHHGVDVDVCAAGAEAVAAARRSHPDVILLDFMMPDLDGKRVLESLRATPDLGGTPIVFLTALGSRRDTSAVTALGADAVLAKPFDPLALPTVLQRVLRQVHG